MSVGVDLNIAPSRAGLVVLLSLLISLSPAVASELKPFATDGCSAFPNGIGENTELWLDCCISHDLAYWRGGTRVERSKADLALKQCVAQTGNPTIARLMLGGVRVGGTPYLPTKFRWGYGWPFLRGYKSLDESEQKKIESSLVESEQ